MDNNLWLAGVGRTNVTCSLRLSFLLVAALATQASSQTILVDDFNDGNADGWTTFDSTVGQPYGPGTFDASSEAFHLEGGGLVPDRAPIGGDLFSIWDQSSNPIFSNGLFRTKIRAETDGTLAYLYLRSSDDVESGYLFAATTHLGGRFGFNKVVRNRVVQDLGLDSSLSFGVNEWWNIEAGAVGDQLSMKVWRVGDPEPESPQLTITDTSLSTGTFGVGSLIHLSPFPGPARVSATFDDIYFTFPDHGDVFTPAPHDIYLWESPMPVPQVEGPFFIPGSPEKPDMRGDVTTSDDWPELRVTGQVTDVDGEPIPGLKLDFWQVDDQGSYDNSGGYDLRGHLFTDSSGNYELWTVMPASYETIRTRHLHAKLGGENLVFESPVYTTQFYFPDPYDNDIDADGTPDQVIEGGVQTDIDAVALAEDFITMADLDAVGAEFSDLASNILTLNNDPLVDGYFDTSLNIVMPQVFQVPDSSELTLLQAGDADQDMDFDQLDLVRVQQSAKYLTGQPATWSEGDWNGAPGGEPGNPPAGNGLFDQLDVIAALGAGTYLTGPYAAIQANGEMDDGQTSVVYNAGTGEVAVDAPAGVELTSINIDSAAGIFTGQAAQNLAGSFDNDADDNIFKATFGSSFGSLSFGNVAQAGLSEQFVLDDLSVVGSLAGGGDLGEVDLIYVPEPASALLLAVGLVIGLVQFRRANR